MTHWPIRYSIIAVALAFAANTVAAQTAPPPDSLLAHPNGAFFALSVADAQRMAAWYRDELGLSIVSQGEAQQGSIRFALLQGQGTVVELIQRQDAKPLREIAPSLAGNYQVHGLFKAGINVRDIDALYARMRARGVPIPYPLEMTKDIALRSFTIRDPEGNLIQFFGRGL